VEVKNLRNGNGIVFIEKYSTLPVNCKMYARITLTPASSIGVHTHIDDEEIIYVVKGKGQVLIDDNFYPLEVGSVNIAKKGQKHSVINNSKKPLVILAIINE